MERITPEQWRAAVESLEFTTGRATAERYAVRVLAAVDLQPGPDCHIENKNVRLEVLEGRTVT